MNRKHILTWLSLAFVAFLAVAWIVNFFGQVGIGTRWGQFDQHFAFRSGRLSISQHGNSMRQGFFWAANSPYDPEGGDRSSLSARLRYFDKGSGHWTIEVPIILLITAVVPVVAGLFSGLRFHLWQFFAFTAILAIELAVFLRK